MSVFPFRLRLALPVAVLLLSAASSACSPSPMQPSPTVANGQSTALEAAAPTPTPVSKCNCNTPTVQFDPGGATPSWGVYQTKNGQSRVGFRINPTCTGTGQSNLCTVYQIEDGSLTWTVGKQSGKRVGKSSKVTFPSVKATDPWEKSYSDALGADYPGNTAEQMTVNLEMTFEIKCVSADDTPKSVKFKVVGSVTAQAAAKGQAPTLTNPVLTFTPQ